MSHTMQPPSSRSSTPADHQSLARQLVADWDMGHQHIRPSELPEYEYISRIDTWEEIAQFLTFGAALDYQRQADTHWATMWALLEDKPKLFYPMDSRNIGQDYLSGLFGAYGVRFKNKDARAWLGISERLRDDTGDGLTSTLVTNCDFDASELVRTLDEGEYPHLTGEKIQPFFLRLLHLNGAPLSNTAGVGVAIDSQIQRVTEYIAPSVESRADAQSFWLEVCDTADIEPLSVDAPLWLVGRDWELWGKDYVDDTLGV